jgi:cell division protein FtsN
MNTNRIIELCLVFLVSILSFSVGTFVGKKYSDNQHKLALLDPNAKDHAPAGAESEHAALTAAANETENVTVKDAVVGTTPITDSDVAKMAEEFSEEGTEDKTADSSNVVKTIDEDGTIVNDTTVVVKNTAATTAKASVTPATIKKVIAAKPVKTENLARAVATISEKANTVIEKNSGSAQYTVQVGAFPSTAEADKVSNSLQARGYKASQVEAMVSGKKWYRVQVGLFNSLEDAQIYKKELVEQNHIPSAIIQRVTK